MDDPLSAASASTAAELGDPGGWAKADGAAAFEVLEASPVAVAGVDGDGALRWANRACHALLAGLRPGVPLASQCGLDAAGEMRLSTALAGAGGTEIAIDGAESHFMAHVQPLAGGRRLVWLVAAERLRRAEAEVQRLSELLHLACDIGRLGIWERDLVTGRGLWDERVFLTRGLVGFGEAPAFDDAAGGIVEADQATFAAAMRQSLQAPAGFEAPPHWRVRYRMRGQDGIVRMLHKQWFVQHGGDGQPLRMIGLVIDDSEAFALLRTRDESVAQLALAADLTGLAVWRHDLATGLVSLSPQAFAVFDIPPRADDLPVEALRELVHPADRPRLDRSVTDALAGGPPADDEIRLRRRDGAWRTLVMRRTVHRDAAGRPLATVGVAIDATERRDATRRAAELGRRFELAIGAAGIGHWTLDGRTRTARWSAPLCLMHGLPPDATVPRLHRWLADFVHPDDRVATRRRIAAWLRRDRRAGARLDLDVRIRRVDGEVRELLLQVVVEDEGAQRTTGRRPPGATPPDAAGETPWAAGPLAGGSLFGLALDVTDRRLAESARRDRERALSESEAKSRFLSRMNHELRTPLHAVLGFAHLLLDEDAGTGPEASKRRQRVVQIRAAGRHLLGLINDALDLSSLEGGEAPLLREPVPLATLVAETLPLVEALCVEHEVRCEAASAVDGTALADPMRLRQVLLNLVSNAIKYNRRGGSVSVAAWAREDTVVLRVADTGRGMTAQQLRHLFEPFNRLGAEREDIEGSGIGLTIVKSLTERMGGTVRVTSEAGTGSVFELHLPAAGHGASQAAVEAAADAVRARPHRTAASRVLLYVEDDPVNVMIMTELLASRRELAVHIARDGGAGLDLARRLQPGLILLDMHLPDLDGLDVLARLRADPLTAAIRVVGLSANAMRDDLERARAAGIDDYWTKPLDHATFLAALDEFFGLERPLVEAPR